MKKLLLLLSIVCGGSLLVEAITPKVHLTQKQKEARAKARKEAEAHLAELRKKHGPKIEEARRHALEIAKAAHTR